jgi:hypothetical protein
MRLRARSAIRVVLVTILALLSVVVLGATQSVTAAVVLAAVGGTTALIVPGTGDPNADLITNYKQNARDYYIAPFNSSCTADSVPPCNLVGIPYPAQFAPLGLLFPGWGGLGGVKWDDSVAAGVSSLNSTLMNTLADNPGGNVVIFGYSQGAAVASIEKGDLAGVTNKDQLSFVLIGNIDRPNGGLFTRLGFLGTVPFLDATTGEPTPTDTGIQTTDIAFEYDGVADYPTFLLNLLADLNADAGFYYVHGGYLNPTSKNPGALPYGYTPETLDAAINDPANQQTFGDTTYVLIPATSLPITYPLIQLGAATGTSLLVTPIVDLIQPTLQTLIDLGYDRSINPGVPTVGRLIPPLVNPITLTTQLVSDAVEGVQNAVGNLGNTTPVPLGDPVDTTTLAVTNAAAGTSGTTPAVTSGTTPAATSGTTLAVAAAGTSGTTPAPTPRPLIRLSAIATPGQGLTTAGTTAGTKPDRPTLRSVLGSDVHPPRDLANSLQNAVNAFKKAAQGLGAAATGTAKAA